MAEVNVTELERTFVYNGAKLADPAPGMTVDEVKDIYTAQYPELSNATVEGPTQKNGAMEYEFKRKVGTKG